jgi:hypothetical protein
MLIKDGYYQGCKSKVKSNKYSTMADEVENFPEFSFYEALEDNDDLIKKWEDLYKYDLDETKEQMYQLY